MKLIRAVTVCLVSMAFAPMALTNDTGTRTFGGYECTEDCSGHAAGYRWAEDKGITDEADCSGDSQSFIEGCLVYLQDPARGADADDDGEPIEG